MAVTYVSTKITQHKVTFAIDENKNIDVVLTDNYGWSLTIPNRKHLTIQELIEMCSLIYSEGIIGSSESIIVYLEGHEPIYVRGINRIKETFIESIIVEVSDSTKR